MALRDLSDPSLEWSFLGQQQTEVRTVREWLVATDPIADIDPVCHRRKLPLVATSVP